MKTRGRATAPLPQGWNSHPREAGSAWGSRDKQANGEKEKPNPSQTYCPLSLVTSTKTLILILGAGVGETPQEREVMGVLQPCTRSPRRAFATAGELQGCFQHGKTRENGGGGELEHTLHPGVCVLHRAPPSGRH